MDIEILKSNRIGKRFITFLRFVDSVKAGKKSIIYASDYVVIDKKTWEDMNEKLRELSRTKIRISKFFTEVYTKEYPNDH